MAPKSNVALLTEGADYIRRAKKARQDQVEEVKWDDESRRDYLTGFSKRKKARIGERRERAKKRDHEAHLEERKRARQELKDRAAQNVRDVRLAMGLSVDDEVESDGEEEEEAAPIETNFSDDEQLATVTVTEDFDFAKSSGERMFIDSDDEEAGISTKKPVVPLLPASSRRAEAKAKSKTRREQEKEAEIKAKAKRDAKKELKKTTSMETPAEKRRAKELEGRKRQKKLDKQKVQAEKMGITLLKGKDFNGARARGSKGGKGGKPGGKPGGKSGGKPAGKKGGARR